MEVITQKQEGFIQDVFLDVNPGQAYLNHYHCKSLGVAGACATRLLKKAKIKDRLDQLRQKVEDASVATVLERKQILTEIARGRLSDFMGEPITSDKLKSAAIQEIRVTDGDISTATVKLHNPIQAIAEINKMTGVYTTSPNVNINNTVNIQENIINAGERLQDAIDRLVARIGEGEVPSRTE